VEAGEDIEEINNMPAYKQQERDQAAA